MTDRELMQQALEALEYADPEQHYKRVQIAITALRDRLAQPEQEPVAWMIWLHGPAGIIEHKQFADLEFARRNEEYPDPARKLLPLYTTPPRREWVGLTLDEFDAIHERCETMAEAMVETVRKLKEKNA